MAERTMAIECAGLSKIFGKQLVLDDVSLEIAEGESVALAGANGTGKSTLLGCLASIVRPSAGVVRWFGRPANRGVESRRLVGMAAHESRLYPHLTLRENLVFAARMYGVPEPTCRADQWLDDFGLRSFADHLPAQVSQGMRQRVAIGRAVVHEPPILLLDEPFSGLDARGIEWLLQLLLGLRRQGRTLCFVTHDKGISRRLADRELLLHAGRIRRQATCDGPEIQDSQPAARAA